MSPRLSGSTENSTALKVGFATCNTIFRAIKPRHAHGIHAIFRSLRLTQPTRTYGERGKRFFKTTLTLMVFLQSVFSVKSAAIRDSDVYT